jgi:hypothetical protein
LIDKNFVKQTTFILIQSREQNVPNIAILRVAGTGTSVAMATPTSRIRLQSFIVKEQQ